MNEYREARLRYEKIAASQTEIRRQAQAIIDWVFREWNAASEGLRPFEESPGVPLLQYRGGPPVDLPSAGEWTLADVIGLLFPAEAHGREENGGTS